MSDMIDGSVQDASIDNRFNGDTPNDMAGLALSTLENSAVDNATSEQPLAEQRQRQVVLMPGQENYGPYQQYQIRFTDGKGAIQQISASMYKEFVAQGLSVDEMADRLDAESE